MDANDVIILQDVGPSYETAMLATTGTNHGVKAWEIRYVIDSNHDNAASKRYELSSECDHTIQQRHASGRQNGAHFDVKNSTNFYFTWLPFSASDGRNHDCECIDKSIYPRYCAHDSDSRRGLVHVRMTLWNIAVRPYLWL